MAQFLIRITDRTHSDSAINDSLYKRGDVVDVFPDGQLQVPQPTAHWAVLTIMGVSVERGKRLVEPDVVFADEDTPVLVRRRLNTFDWAALPAAWVAALTTGDRALTLTVQDVRNYIRNKRTGNRVNL